MSEVRGHVYREFDVYNHPGEGTCALSSLRSTIEYFEPGKLKGWSEVERILPYKFDEGCRPSEMAFALLDRGYRIECVSKFDAAAYQQRGLDYLFEYYEVESDSPLWSPSEFYAYWSTEELDSFSHDIRSSTERVGAYGSAYKAVVELPTFDTVRQMLSQGIDGSDNRIVHMVLEGNIQNTAHSALAIGYTALSKSDSQFLVADPHPASPPIDLPYVITEESLAVAWLPYDGIYSISLPQAK